MFLSAKARTKCGWFKAKHIKGRLSSVLYDFYILPIWENMTWWKK
jgi:hypothetical protein